MTFTKDQMEVLSRFESYFNTAINANYSRHPGHTNLLTIYEVYTGATGDRRRFDDNCQHCILSIIRDCGRIYYRDKEEMSKSKEVKTEDIPVKKVRAKVKTVK